MTTAVVVTTAGWGRASRDIPQGIPSAFATTPPPRDHFKIVAVFLFSFEIKYIDI